MNKHIARAAIALIFILTSQAALSQVKPQMITIPVSRPGEPITLEIGILSARIEVIGEDRQDAEFAITIADGERKIITPSGAKTLSGGGYELEVEEEDNYIYVDTDWRANRVEVVARIPRRADLDLSTTNDGEIIVRDITGNLQLQNTNGPISATNISGSVIAETVNDDIMVSFTSVADSEAMALASYNGNINLALPSNAGVELHLDNSQGEIISDFEVEIRPSKPIVERDEDEDGISVRVESVIVAAVNGGGPVIRLTTLNGDIQITKAN